MVNRNWGNWGNWGNWDNRDNHMMNVEYLPDQVSNTRFSEPRVSPTQQYVQRNISNHIVPHVHPSHLTTIHRQNIHHQHHFPHTHNVKHECCETHTMCEQPFNPWHRNCR